MRTLKSLVSRMLVSVLCVCLLIPTLCSSAFAKSFDMINGCRYVVTEDGYLEEIAFRDLTNKTISIPSNVKVVGGNVLNGIISSNYAKGITLIEVPENVEKIEANAFASCSNKNLVINVNNYSDGLTVEAGAFPSNAKVNYKERPTTTAPATTKPQEPPTKAPESARPTRIVVVTKNHVTTTKKHNNPVTTTSPSESTTLPEEETTTDVVEIIDEVPFAEAQNQLSDVNLWDKLTSQTTQAPEKPVSTASKAESVLGYSSIVVVAFSAVILSYFKFKK